MNALGRLGTLCLLAVAAACAGPDRAAAPENAVALDGSVAAFDWFEYEGRDPVYEGLNVSGEDYLNPILAGFYPDPSIVQVGGDYYLVNSTFSYFPGIPIFHSRDLVHWTQIGNVIDRPSQLDFKNLRMSRGVFAPSIAYYDGTFYVLNTCVDCGGNFVVTATDPAGPWSDPVWLPEMGGIDPSLYFDTDGRAYIINNDAPIGEPLYDGHRALWVQEFDYKDLKLIGPRKLVVNGGVDITQKPVWIEGPHFFRREGQLYLIAAEGGTAINHSEVVFKADSVFGPMTPYAKNPILTQRHLDPDRAHPITSVGHAAFVQDAEGGWWATFLGVRPYEGDFYNTGRETYLMPVRWTEDGWPVMTQGDELVPYVGKKPALPAQPAPPAPTSGNFSLREEFDGDALAPYWLFVRQPQGPPWHDLKEGRLEIAARGQSLGSYGRPSFIARRQQHLHASASVSMRYRPTQAGDMAGIAAFQNDDYYYFLGLALGEDGGVEVEVRKCAGPDDEQGVVIASVPYEGAADAPVFLRIEARGGVYDFSYATQAGDWTSLLEGADGKILSTRTAGGFIGAVFGMYAYRADATLEE